MPLIWVVFGTMLTFKNPFGSGLLPLPAALHKLAQLQSAVHRAELISLDAFEHKGELLQLKGDKFFHERPRRLLHLLVILDGLSRIHELDELSELRKEPSAGCLWVQS